jgi:hypothetical protein
MHWPQIVMIVLYSLGIALELGKHDEPKTGRHNVFSTLIASAIGVWLLHMGGFWK